MEEKVYLSDMESRLLRFLLLKGAHFSVYDIGRELRLSPQTIAYKIKQLEEKKYIKSYHYRVNPYKIGLDHMALCVFELKKRMELEGMEETLLSHPNVFSVNVLTGQIDLLCKVFYKHPRELSDLMEWIGLNLKEMTRRVSLIPVMEVNKIYQVKGIDNTPFELDDTSRQVLDYKLLHPDASLKETAKAIGLHRNTVSKKWNELWDKNVVLKKDLVLDPRLYKELGFDLKACVFIDTPINEKTHTIKELSALDSVHELFSLAYRRDLLALIRSSDISNYYGKIKRIWFSKRVSDTESLIVLSSREKNLMPVNRT
jgi:DNA-binding Lrp family transcriptional regulator